MPEHRRWRVEVSAGVLARARRMFPHGGSVDGTPSFDLFVRGPLQGAVECFGRAFEDALQPLPGTGIRQLHTIDSCFPAMVFYALRVDDHVEIVEFTLDPDYWEMVGDDPLG